MKFVKFYFSDDADSVDDTDTGQENGSEKNLGFKVLKAYKTPKVQNLGFKVFKIFVGQFLYRSYLISCFNRDL